MGFVRDEDGTIVCELWSGAVAAAADGMLI